MAAPTGRLPRLGGAADFPINGRDGEYPNLSAIAAADSPFAMRACISILPSIANSERLLPFLAISLHLSECRAGRENDSAPAEKRWPGCQHGKVSRLLWHLTHEIINGRRIHLDFFAGGVEENLRKDEQPSVRRLYLRQRGRGTESRQFLINMAGKPSLSLTIS